MWRTVYPTHVPCTYLFFLFTWQFMYQKMYWLIGYVTGDLGLRLKLTNCYLLTHSALLRFGILCQTLTILSCFLFDSWWSMLKHFSWSLLGLTDLDPLNSVDDPSMILAYFLYGAFLIMAVILLVNMLIALLSNTYQKVAVRYIHIRTYFIRPKRACQNKEINK